MLETCGYEEIVTLASAAGKRVSGLRLRDIPSFSLVQIKTTSGNTYLIETLPEEEDSDTRVRMICVRSAAKSRAKHTMRDARIKATALSEGHPIVYYTEDQRVVTQPIMEISLLSS